MMWKILVLVVALCVFHQVFCETGCPEDEDIQPCICRASPQPILVCKNLTDVETLRNVFVNSNRYTYDEVYIKYSTLQYLPYDIFEKVEVHKLHLKNVTLTNLFDRPPKALNKLTALDIQNCKVRRGIFFEILKPLTSLKYLNVYYQQIRTLGEDFSTNAPRGLEQLTLYETDTRIIKPGVFANFPKLDKVAIDAGKIVTLTRDIFPTPFNGRFIYFNDNKISKIPKNMFQDMPRLETLSLRKNQISELRKEVFDSPESVSKMKYLMLEDNPLKCDCFLVWLVNNKPETLTGKCASPRKLKDKELKDLDSSKFNC